MKDDSDRELALFTEAIRVPLQDREAFLDQNCGDDISLRRNLEALLSAYDRIGTFLEEPPMGGPSE